MKSKQQKEHRYVSVSPQTAPFDVEMDQNAKRQQRRLSPSGGQETHCRDGEEMW